MVSPIVFFDGECGLCSRVVRFINRYEKKEVISFSPLQSDFAIKVLAKKKYKARFKYILFLF